MLRETADRLSSLFPASHLWVVTNHDQAAGVRRELPRIPRPQILIEPIGRNTASAIGLAAIHLAKKHGDALMAVLPADHYIGDASRYRRIVRAALTLADRPGNLVVLGIPPTRPDTGFGYIERGKSAPANGGLSGYSVRRFTEKPNRQDACKYIAAGKYFWNAGMFFWRVSTFLECLAEFLPQTRKALAELEPSIGTSFYARTLAKIYPHLKNISVDYAVMERATRRNAGQNVFVLPANVGWSDIGSWEAVHELLAGKKNANVSSKDSFTLDASGNFLWSPKKFVAAIGIHDLIVVETEDALLLCPRERAQDVGKIVKWLEQKRRHNLL